MPTQDVCQLRTYANSGRTPAQDVRQLRTYASSGRTPAQGVRQLRRYLEGILPVNNAVREISSTMLSEAGFVVVEAGSGGAALEIFRGDYDGFDVAVLDFATPGMNGAELARELRRLNPQTLVLFVTGYADLEALGDLPEHQLLQKPFSNDQLMAKLEALTRLAGWKRVNR